MNYYILFFILILFYNFKRILLFYISYCPDYLISKKDIKLRMFKENKIALIIPITSNNKDFNNIEEIDFIKIFLPSFLKTYDTSNKYEYTFYLGYDHDDRYLSL